MNVSELPSHKKLSQDIDSLKSILKIYKFFRIFGLKSKRFDKVSEQLENLTKQYNKHKEYAAKF
ncbi:hypothetical protein MNBD_BACTEROID05-462, partial [hydrothermal vent metagenome]